MASQPRYDLRLHGAQTPEDVVHAARDYLAGWAPADLARMPPHLRPHKIVDAEDVNAYAFDLLQQQQFAMDPRSSPELHEMANFFSCASIRLSHIGGRGDSRLALRTAEG